MIVASLQGSAQRGRDHLQSDGPLSGRLRWAIAQACWSPDDWVSAAGVSADTTGLAACVRRLLCLYDPLEARLLCFGQWSVAGFDMPGLSPAGRLRAALQELSPCAAKPLHAPRQALPHLPTFAHALGGLYAMARSLPTIGPASGAPRAGANTFCANLDQPLDQHGAGWPASIPLAVEGAERTLESTARWMDVRHWRQEMQP